MGAADADVDALLAEGDPWWQLDGEGHRSRRGAATRKRRWPCRASESLSLMDTAMTRWHCASSSARQPYYPHLAGLQPDLYRCFMEQTWRHQSSPMESSA